MRIAGYKHYSLHTKETYLYWEPFFVRWHGRSGQVRRIVEEA